MTRVALPHAFAAFALLAALAACAALGPRIEAPRVTVVDVRLDRIEGADAWFVAGVDVANPNAQPIAIDAIDATLSIEGQDVATASLTAPVQVAPNGTSSAEIAAHTGIDAILRAVANAMRRMGGGIPGQAPSLHYAIEGKARLGSGLTIPFRRSGELRSRPEKRSAP
jgi:LEA14-like dessication related protein